jgi:hypothetical protein
MTLQPLLGWLLETREACSQGNAPYLKVTPAQFVQAWFFTLQVSPGPIRAWKFTVTPKRVESLGVFESTVYSSNDQFA